jgi:anti-sigma regulatory factor (Ser/Thr protein kinase)
VHVDQESSRAFGANPTSVVEARRFVRLQAAGWPVASEDLELVTSELATNALCHGGGGFELTLSRQSSEVLVEVRDRVAARPYRRHVGVHSPSGRGLLIIERLARSWGVRDLPGEGKVVWAWLSGREGPAN